MCFPRYSASYHLEHLRVADIKCSTPIGRRQSSYDAMNVFQGLIILCFFAFQTAIYGAQLLVLKLSNVD